MQYIHDSDKRVASKQGDLFTRAPVEYGKHLIMLGRFHVHILNTENNNVSLFKDLGQRHCEDEARKIFWKDDFENVR